ncbi:putative UDP-glucuronate:xylan alpha-glucuronosyltransferase 3 [Aristolochia californica]|uniref:putative UDP-glucuronate:xylan alpha-glucuronosyltransferase 3 n=1 Tax=Aristolochia californica TaxID=171875 RepID=UPI0035D92B6F
MRGPIGASPILAEARHRSSGSVDDSNRRRFHKSKDFKDAEKAPYTSVQDRSSSCKFLSFKLVLVIIVCGTFLMLLLSPTSYQNEQIFRSSSRSRLVDIGWIWERAVGTDLRYVSDSEIDWTKIKDIVKQLFEGKQRNLKIGLLNFNGSEINRWRQLIQDAESVVVYLDYASISLTWEALYPEWIDEEEELEVPVCPSLPEPQVPKGSHFDLVAVKLPCHRQRSKNWSRDIARLHLQLAAAKVAASARGNHPVHVLFITECFPIANLFTCKELIVQKGNTWLYKPNLRSIREKLKLPVGSCELSVPLNAKERSYLGSAYREAYATILHSAHVYVCGAIAAAQSIRLSGSMRDLVILVDETISEYHRGGLEAAGWKIRTIQRIRNPKAERDAYNEWNYSKFRLWQLTDYDKIIFIDADLLILRNIDFLFGMPEISATGNDATLFNSGVMVIEPSNCTFKLLMDHINEIESYNGGDQGYLNEIFTWWHRIPKHINFLKHFWIGDEEEKKVQKTRLFGADPPILYVLHYLGNKPWVCFRDFDCNWNVDILQEFASDVAHARWWRVHDKMPENLQKFCLLNSKQKAQLEWDRRQAEKAKYPDEHWTRNISDPRLKTCIDEYCFWESMLWHWGETNWTDNGSVPSLHVVNAVRQKKTTTARQKKTTTASLAGL